MAEPMVATKETVEQIFDGAAPEYGRTGPDFFRTFGARLVDWMVIQTGARVLDVGVGTGAVLLPAALRVGPVGRVVGIDLSSAMLKQARRASDEAGLTNVELHKMDAEQLTFPEDSFDAVACGFGLFFLPSMETGLREMLRVSRKGARLGLTMWGKSPPPFDPAWKMLADLFRKFGVEVRMPQRIAYAPAELESLLARSGWTDVQVRAETSDVVYSSEEEWWRFQFTLGARAALQRLPEEKRVQFREEYLGQLRPLFREDGLHLPAPVLYAIAEKQDQAESQ